MEHKSQVTCWIASEVSKYACHLHHYQLVSLITLSPTEFYISWKASYSHLKYLPCTQLGTLYVDGAPCNARITRQHASDEGLSTIKGIDTSPTTQRPLLFSTMELTGKSFHIPRQIQVMERAIQTTTHTPHLQQKIHERSKKGSTHSVRYICRITDLYNPISENLKPWKRNSSATVQGLKN